MAGEFSFLPFRPLIPFALMDFASGSYVVLLSVRKIAQRLDHQKQPKIVTSRPQLKISLQGT